MPDIDIVHPRGRGGKDPPKTAPPPKPAPPTPKPKPEPPRTPKKSSPLGKFVPSLIRFLILVGGVVAVVYGAMYYLANNVQVHPREMTEIIEIPKAGK